MNTPLLLLSLLACSDNSGGDWVDTRNSCQRYEDAIEDCYDDAEDAGLVEQFSSFQELDGYVTCPEDTGVDAREEAIYECLDEVWSRAECDTLEGLLAAAAQVGACNLASPQEAG